MDSGEDGGWYICARCTVFHTCHQKQHNTHLASVRGKQHNTHLASVRRKQHNTHIACARRKITQRTSALRAEFLRKILILTYKQEFQLFPHKPTVCCFAWISKYHALNLWQKLLMFLLKVIAVAFALTWTVLRWLFGAGLGNKASTVNLSFGAGINKPNSNLYCNAAGRTRRGLEKPLGRR